MVHEAWQYSIEYVAIKFQIPPEFQLTQGHLKIKKKK